MCYNDDDGDVIWTSSAVHDEVHDPCQIIKRWSLYYRCAHIEDRILNMAHYHRFVLGVDIN